VLKNVLNPIFTIEHILSSFRPKMYFGYQELYSYKN